MRVVDLTTFPVRIPLRRPIKHASFRRTETENLVVRCALEDGTVGWGEGVPREYVTGETIDTTLDLLRRSDLAGQLEPCRDFARAVALAERIRLAPVPGDDRDPAVGQSVLRQGGHRLGGARLRVHAAGVRHDLQVRLGGKGWGQSAEDVDEIRGEPGLLVPVLEQRQDRHGEFGQVLQGEVVEPPGLRQPDRGIDVIPPEPAPVPDPHPLHGRVPVTWRTCLS